MKKLIRIACAILMFAAIYGEGQAQVTTSDAWINEFHYNNTGSDIGEFVEVVIKSADGYDLSLFTLTLYNGNGGVAYASPSLSTFTPGDTVGDYYFYYKEISDIQNDNDGFALSYEETLIQFISYGGEFIATNGPAKDSISTDVGIEEPNSTPIGESLQLTGAGSSYEAFTWDGPFEDSPGSINYGQSFFPIIRFTSNGSAIGEDGGSFSIEAEILNPDGKEVSVDVVFNQNSSSSETTDFSSSLSRTIIFGPDAADGQKKTVSFTIVDDEEYEGTERAVFALTNLNTDGEAIIGQPSMHQLTIEDNETPFVVINEILADPGNADVDGDGTSSSDNDEFVEIVNAESVYVDISNWSLSDKDKVTHVFAEGTILPPGGAIVVFGSPDLYSGSFGGSLVQGTTSLSLHNSGDTVTLKDNFGNEIDAHSFTEEEGDDDQSLVRDPEITGAFVKHASATGSGHALFSPGTKTDGSIFTTNILIDGNAGWRMLSSPVSSLPFTEITDDTPIQGIDDDYDVNFYTGYDGSTFTHPSSLDGTLESGRGFILYFYNNEIGGSSTLPVVLDFGDNSEPQDDVTVTLHSNGDGWNLLGNPFQVAFDISALMENGGSLASANAQVWDDATESYILTTTNNNKVAAGQGFFIQNNTDETAAASVTFPETGKTSGTKLFKLNAERNAFVQLELSSESANGAGKQRDLSTILYFNENANSDWDKWDLEKLYPLKESFSILNLVSQLSPKVKAQDSRSYSSEQEVFHLDVQSYNVMREQEIKWLTENDIPEEWEFTFKDNLTGEEQIMDKDFSYTFHQKNIVYPAEKSIQPKAAESVRKKKEESTARFTITLKRGKAVPTEIVESPENFALEQNYPNPFNPVTSIKYAIAKPGLVSLEIYNVVGQKVATLVDEVKQAGNYQLQWNAAEMASGVYYYRLKSSGQVITKKMTLIK